MTANPSRVKPWWYRMMTVQFAVEHYSFPLSPVNGDEHVPGDGSIWAFDVNQTGRWELMNYSDKCVCLDCAGTIDEAELGEYCTECLLIGCRDTVRSGWSP